MSHRLKLLLTTEAETSLLLPFTLHPVYLRALTLFTTKVRTYAHVHMFVSVSVCVCVCFICAFVC